MSYSENTTSNESVEVGRLHPKRGADTNGTFMFVAQGTFDGATVSLQGSTDGGTTKWDYGTDTTLTASGGGTFSVLNNSDGDLTLYVTTSSAGASTDVDWNVFTPKG